MTSVFGNAVARVYGASELGVLSITARGEEHPRVEYIGGEVFVGLDVDGVAVTRGQAEAVSRPFRVEVVDAVASAPAVPAPHDGVIVIANEATASAVLLEPARIDADALASDPVFFVLSRTRIAIVGADDEAGVGRVLDLAEQLYEAGGRLVSAHPIMWIGGGWAPFDWAERLPSLAMRFERVLRLFSVRAYEAQTAALQPGGAGHDPRV